MKEYKLDKWTSLKIERISITKFRIYIYYRVSLLEELEERWYFEISYLKFRQILNGLLKIKILKK